MTVRSIWWRLNRSVRNEAAAVLLNATVQLEELMRTTERDFLAVGGKLDSIATGVRKQAAALEEFSGSLGGEAVESLACGLNEAMRWGRGLGDEAGLSGTLGELLPIAEAVRTPSRDLQGTIRMLRVMSVMTRVEAAHLGSRAAGFDSLADQLDSLVNGVEERAEAILDAVDDTCTALSRARAGTDQIEQRQRVNLQALLAESATGLEEVRAQQGAAAAVSSEVRTGYERLNAGVGKIFTALQFHDSTRQRLEHVRFALGLLAREMSSRRSISPSVVLRSVALQTVQLAEAQRCFRSSVDGVREDLAELAELALGFSGSARELSAGPEGGGERRAPGMAGHCVRVAGVIGEWVQSRAGLAETAVRLGESCARISGFTAEIEAVGIKLLWLAVNAEIQAASLDGHGAVMESVAECIRGVSQRASSCSSRVAAALLELGSTLGALAGSQGGSGDARVSKASRLKGRIQVLADELERVLEGQSFLLNAIVAGGDVLSREISALRDGISAHMEMDRSVNECLEMLALVAGGVRVAAGPAADEEFDGPLVAVDGNYTMKAEREVHEAFAGVVAPLPQVAVPAGASEFGGNVELF